MPDPLDVYCDQFQVHLGPYGAVLNFRLTQSQPPPQGTPVASDRVSTVRMSLEHLKIMAYMLRMQVVGYEQRFGVRIQLPQEVLNAGQIGREDWDAFWRGEP